ncbi:MAG: rubrerythrin family protein [Halorientalis sp.]
MDADAFLEAVRADERTALERLGSDKSLLAATGADLSAPTVLGVVAGHHATLAATYRDWAAAADAPAAHDAFADAATRADDHREALAAERAGEPPERDAPVTAVEADGDVARLGALVGQGLVDDRTLLQVVSFFLNEADEARADLAREARDAANETAASGADALTECCGSDDEWARARAAATDVIEAAYATYAETLEGMGIDPKPVC